MRIDKFLWCVRIFKTRSLATNACKQGKVTINNLPAKPSREVRVNDIISITFSYYKKTIFVLDIPPSRVGAALIHKYVEDRTPAEEYERRNQMQKQAHSFYFRPPGSGRPTKKERRALEKFLRKN
ncbi:MAG: RNA-binding S4 domain-containing protein [Bacteroidales bacterium]|nr:RNA-binding S4 domain-containing protein [Bacteroidales bacterium]